MTAHSTVPWKCSGLTPDSSGEDPPVCYITDEPGDIIAQVWKPMNPATDATTLANGQHIERCVNCHDELLAACVAAKSAIECLIEKRPMAAAALCGSTTLGNLRAELKAVIVQATGQAVQP